MGRVIPNAIPLNYCQARGRVQLLIVNNAADRPRYITAIALTEINSSRGITAVQDDDSGKWYATSDSTSYVTLSRTQQFVQYRPQEDPEPELNWAFAWVYFTNEIESAAIGGDTQTTNARNYTLYLRTNRNTQAIAVSINEGTFTAVAGAQSYSNGRAPLSMVIMGVHILDASNCLVEVQSRYSDFVLISADAGIFNTTTTYEVKRYLVQGDSVVLLSTYVASASGSSVPIDELPPPPDNAADTEYGVYWNNDPFQKTQFEYSIDSATAIYPPGSFYHRNFGRYLFYRPDPPYTAPAPELAWREINPLSESITNDRFFSWVILPSAEQLAFVAQGTEGEQAIALQVQQEGGIYPELGGFARTAAAPLGIDSISFDADSTLFNVLPFLKRSLPLVVEGWELQETVSRAYVGESGQVVKFNAIGGFASPVGQFVLDLSIDAAKFVDYRVETPSTQSIARVDGVCLKVAIV